MGKKKAKKTHCRAVAARAVFHLLGKTVDLNSPHANGDSPERINAPTGKTSHLHSIRKLLLTHRCIYIHNQLVINGMWLLTTFSYVQPRKST